MIGFLLHLGQVPNGMLYLKFRACLSQIIKQLHGLSTVSHKTLQFRLGAAQTILLTGWTIALILFLITYNSAFLAFKTFFLLSISKCF